MSTVQQRNSGEVYWRSKGVEKCSSGVEWSSRGMEWSTGIQCRSTLSTKVDKWKSAVEKCSRKEEVNWRSTVEEWRGREE